MEEWLKRIWRSGESLSLRVIALVVLIFVSIVGLVALVSDVGFSEEVRVHRRGILVSIAVAAVLLSVVVLMWNSPSGRRVKIGLRLFMSTAFEWMRGKWLLMLGLGVLVSAISGVYLLTGSIWAAVVALGLAVGVILLTLSCPLRYRTELKPHPGFHEDFAYGDLSSWKYSGDWRVQMKEKGEQILVITRSEVGGIAKPCLGWRNYLFSFETKIIRHSTSWIIRAASRGHYVMLQCQKDRIRPHFRQADKWALPEKWTRPITVRVSPSLPLDEWFSVRIEVKGVRVTVLVDVDGETREVLCKDLLTPPIAPEKYMIGSVGFRESQYECAHFRNVHVEEI